MNAQVITIRPLTRPPFNQTRIADFGLWCLDNSRALARYWADCGRALGLSCPESADEQEFDLWLREIWSTEKSKACLPHTGDSL